MKLIYKARRSGRTYELIQMANKPGTCIVTTSHRCALAIVRQAENMGLHIQFPLVYDDFFTGVPSPGVQEFLFDDLDVWLDFRCRGAKVGAIVLEEQS